MQQQEIDELNEDARNEEYVKQTQNKADEVKGIIEEIEMFEEDLDRLMEEKKQFEVHNMFGTGFEATDQIIEIEKTEKQLDELYEQLQEKMKEYFEPQKLDPLESETQKPNLQKQDLSEELKEDEIGKKAEENILDSTEDLEKDTKSAERINDQGNIKYPPRKKEETALTKPSKWQKIKKALRKFRNKALLIISTTASAITGQNTPGRTFEKEETNLNVGFRDEEINIEKNKSEITWGETFESNKDITYYYRADKTGPTGVLQAGTTVRVGTENKMNQRIGTVAIVRNGHTIEVDYNDTVNIDELKKDFPGDYIMVHIEDAKTGGDLGWIPAEEAMEYLKEEISVKIPVLTVKEETKTVEKNEPGEKVYRKRDNYIEIPPHDEPRISEPYNPPKESEEQGNVSIYEKDNRNKENKQFKQDLKVKPLSRIERKQELYKEIEAERNKKEQPDSEQNNQEHGGR